MSEQLQLSNHAPNGKPEILPSRAFIRVVSSLIYNNLEMSASGRIDEYDVRAVQLTRPSEHEDTSVNPTYAWLANEHDEPSNKFYGLVISEGVTEPINNKIYTPRIERGFNTRNWFASAREEALSVIEHDHEEVPLKSKLRDDQDGSGDPAKRELLSDLNAIREMYIQNMPGLNKAVKKAVYLGLY